MILYALKNVTMFEKNRKIFTENKIFRLAHTHKHGVGGNVEKRLIITICHGGKSIFFFAPLLSVLVGRKRIPWNPFWLRIHLYRQGVFDDSDSCGTRREEFEQVLQSEMKSN